MEGGLSQTCKIVIGNIKKNVFEKDSPESFELENLWLNYPVWHLSTESRIGGDNYNEMPFICVSKCELETAREFEMTAILLDPLIWSVDGQSMLDVK